MARSKQKERQQENKEKLVPILGSIYPKSPNQKLYFKSLKQNIYTFAVGPAGTGKTFIALWHGLKALLDRNNPIERIVIVRPLVEVKNFDESKLGALPGDVKEKMMPWMGALMDSLREVMSEHDMHKVLNRIEVYNMALCRGRSFANTFLIVDEAQNITVEGDGMKMLLTRLGQNSQMVVVGDLKQSDLNNKKASALKDAIKKFHNEEGFGVCILEPVDIVRNEYISKILKIYGDFEDTNQKISIEDILKD